MERGLGTDILVDFLSSWVRQLVSDLATELRNLNTYICMLISIANLTANRRKGQEEGFRWVVGSVYN